MTLTALVTILYMVSVLAVGYFTTRRKTGGAREFFVAGGQLSWMVLVPFLLAEYIHAGTTVGVAEKVHKDGITTLMYYAAVPLGLSILVFGLARFYYRIKKVTLGEVFATLFDQKTRMAYVISTLVSGSIGSGLSALALATVVGPMVGISYESAIWVSAVFLVIMAFLGLRGQAWMNVIHFGAILVCFIPLAIAAVGASGGWGKIAAALPPRHLNPMAAGLPTISAWFISVMLIYQMSLIATTALFAARSETDGKKACITAGFGVFAFVLLPAVMGLTAYVLAPGTKSIHALWGVSAHLGEWATILASIGVLAAIVSTTPSIFLMYGAMVSRDLIMSFRPNLSEKMQVVCARITVVVIGLGSVFLSIIAAEQSGGILAYAFKSTQARVVITLPLILSVLWRRINPTIVFWIIVMGVSTGFTWLFAGSPFGVEPLWPALAVTLVILVFGSLIAKPAHFKGAEGLAPAANPGKEGSNSSN